MPVVQMGAIYRMFVVSLMDALLILCKVLLVGMRFRVRMVEHHWYALIAC